MSHIPIFSYKQYLDDMMRLKDQGHVDVDIQVARPTSAGSRGLARTRDFVKQPVHMMGESQGVVEANNPAQQAAIAIAMKKKNKKPKLETKLAEKKKITKNAAIKAVLEGIGYSKTSGELILPEAIQGNVRTWFESRWTNITNKK
jgi:hypothetical protein